ncbi:hypothetical protein, partial [Lysinibacillus sp. NPDC059133]|uniref:hypothetical protein n=1 Tax=Lysinibacillus sp. NPDC059133 TaxID=3346737 RepID=UPI0036B7E28E
GDSLGISVTDETLERAARVKRLIGRPQESTQPERKSTPRYDDELEKSNIIHVGFLYFEYFFYRYNNPVRKVNDR